MELSCESSYPADSPDCLLIDRSAVHIASGSQVAIKRINPFPQEMFIYRTLREIKLLRHFR